MLLRPRAIGAISMAPPHGLFLLLLQSLRVHCQWRLTAPPQAHSHSYGSVGLRRMISKSLLTQKIPDSALMHIRKVNTMKERWDAITTKYAKKGTFAQTDLCTCFLKSKCPEKGNVWQFLEELCIKREELATVGVDVDEKDYCSTIISSLPIPLANFASNQLAFTKIYSPTKMIAPNSLISLISEEYERQHAQRTVLKAGPMPQLYQDLL